MPKPCCEDVRSDEMQLRMVASRVVQRAPCWTADGRGVHASKAKAQERHIFLFANKPVTPDSILASS